LDVRRAGSGPPPRVEVRVWDALCWIAASCLAVNVGQVLWEGGRSGALSRWVGVGGPLALCLLVGAKVWAERRTLAFALSDLRFAIAILLALGAATLAGTLVWQTQKAEVFFARYREAAPALTWGHLHALHQSWWFGWLLTLFAAALVASIIRRAAWRRRELGFLLSHGGVVLLLAGGALGGALGLKGLCYLEAGMPSAQLLSAKGQKAQLPFALSLERVEQAPPAVVGGRGQVASTIGVERQGRRVLSGVVREGEPLGYDGYAFYQAGYDSKSPRYSGILVVKDPGLWFAYAGLVLAVLGVAYLMLLRPGRGRSRGSERGAPR